MVHALLIRKLWSTRRTILLSRLIPGLGLLVFILFYVPKIFLFMWVSRLVLGLLECYKGNSIGQNSTTIPIYSFSNNRVTHWVVTEKGSIKTSRNTSKFMPTQWVTKYKMELGCSRSKTLIQKNSSIPVTTSGEFSSYCVLWFHRDDFPLYQY